MPTTQTHPTWCQSDHDRGDPVHFGTVDLDGDGGTVNVFIASRPEDGFRPALHVTGDQGQSIDLDATQTRRLAELIARTSA